MFTTNIGDIMKLKQIIKIFFVVFTFILINSCDTVDSGTNNEDIENPHGATILTCEDFLDDVRLEDDPSKEVDYIIDCFVEVNDIEVEIIDGTVVEFTQSSGIIFTGSARVNFFALPGSVPPVILRGNKSEKGFWKGIHVKSDQGSNLMNGVEIYDAGSTSDPDFYGAITISGGCQLINVVVGNSANYGIYFNTDLGINNGLSTAKITDCASYPIRIGANDVSELFGYSTYIISNNNHDRVQVETEEITNSIAFYDRGIPYEIDGIITASSVRLEDGVKLAFNPGSRLIITGQITAWSEPDNPIKLYGLEGFAGSWQGIYIDCANPSTSNKIINVHISDGGEETYGSANISIKSGNVTLNECRVTNSRTCGVRINLTDGVLFERDNFFSNNQTGHICEE